MHVLLNTGASLGEFMFLDDTSLFSHAVSVIWRRLHRICIFFTNVHEIFFTNVHPFQEKFQITAVLNHFKTSYREMPHRITNARFYDQKNTRHGGMDDSMIEAVCFIFCLEYICFC